MKRCGIHPRAAIHLTEAKRFVRSRYLHVARAGDYVAAFGCAFDERHFVELIIVDPELLVLGVGELSDDACGE